MVTDATRNLVEKLKDAAAYPHGTDKIQIVETHISYVLLTGQFAYKIKKPVKLAFVDFSSLDQRHHFCHRELELNRRFAAELYLDVVPIGGTADNPVIGAEPPIEFAVRMRQFDPDRAANEMVNHGELDRSSIVAFARRIAEFHASLSAATGHSQAESTQENLDELDRALGNIEGPDETNPITNRTLQSIRCWMTEADGTLEATFAEREKQGFVRDCHGDLHLGNVAQVDGRLVPFDCLEFDDRLRTIDLIDEVAFFSMDLIAHERKDLAWSFIDAYLQQTGDYDGLRVWRYYCVHRALVRAKVRYLASDSPDSSAENATIDPYLGVADRLSAPANPVLVITMGLSGSGKTTVTDELTGQLPAIRVRSDIERKRLSDLPELAASHSGVGQGLYDESTNDATYDRLCHAAQSALTGGVNIIVDASFLDRERRMNFRNLAATCGARFVILNCTAPHSTLRARIEQRAESQADASEASIEVLNSQIEHCDSLDANERRQSINIDTSQQANARELVASIETIAVIPDPID